MLRGLGVSVLLFIIWNGIWLSPVLAHASLRSAKPAPGETLTTSPEHIELIFTEKISVATIALFDREGGAIPMILQPLAGNETVSATIDAELETGEYRVLWNVISADGHPINGSYNFAVDAKSDHSSEASLFLPMLMLGLSMAALALTGGWLYRRRTHHQPN